MRRMYRLPLVALIISLGWMMPNSGALAQGGLAIIRDAEIEGILRAYTTPLFEAAGIPPKSVKIRLINRNSLNAFVAGGRNIFVHTGLLTASKGPDAVIGVLAHEIGHIEGGHLVRTRAAIKEAGTMQVLGTLLGVIAAVGTKNSEAGQAIILGSQSAATNTFMKYSRTQESAADQAAMRLMDETERSSKGLESFLSQLGEQEVLTRRLQDPYAQTHPLSRDRIQTLRNHITSSPYSKRAPTEDELLSHAIVVAKIKAFFNPFRNTLRAYPESDTSFPARYARTIAYYRDAQIDKALPMINQLIAEMPKNPFLRELKGQMLFEFARADEALEAYTQAVQLAPDEPLIIMELARVELEVGTPDMLDKAIGHYKAVHRLGGANGFTWKQLGIAFGRKGDMTMSSLALAESELRTGQIQNAEYHANRALDGLKVGSPEHLQAQDILEAIKTVKSRRK
ncbi:M48 family metalloprotease [Magnetovibrio sp. PR-2]|uniref:M48 family metalloprotease n=1 Tax=Magnetovibrio sp. PR-2 TaxID=3120356 RepID=UPI002FCE07D4